MRSRMARLAWAVALVGVGACSFVDDFDRLRTPAKASARKIEPTGGSGQLESSSYRLRVSVGLPQPIGVVESPRYRLELGSSSL